MNKRQVHRDVVGLRVAHAWSLLGTCGRRQVGALLCDSAGQTLSTGYNGPASGEPHCRDTGGAHDRACAGRRAPSGTALDACEALHAEWNAIARCPDISRIHTAYVTASPCMTCVKMLMGTMCRRIVFVDEYPHPEAKAKWVNSRAADGGDRVWIQIKDGVVNVTRRKPEPPKPPETSPL